MQKTGKFWKKMKKVSHASSFIMADEKMLGNSFLKKILTGFVITKLKLTLKEQNLFTNLYKKITCKKPAMETP